MNRDVVRIRRRDEGLRRVGTWTRRVSLAAAAAAAALTAGYAHALPDLTAHLPGLHAERDSGDQGGTGNQTGGSGTGSNTGTSAQPPGAGTGTGHTTTGAS
ncbi:hypothetical protein [Phaeacidiphilus oryzae]|uniref:hypothetical protein n=1 Tax=Phaeacidiphilus oryzae TaxID=348818 RepID=UPI0005660F93|nr:hypothetical protein [Phaeacidiphilus oryzae]